MRAVTVAIVLLAFAASVRAQTTALPDPGSRIPDPGSRIPDPNGIDKTGIFVDSLALLGIEHGIRLAFQPGTRREVRRNIWRDHRQYFCALTHSESGR